MQEVINIAIKAVDGLKSVPGWQRKAEEELERKMQKLFDNAASRTLKIIEERFPRDELARRIAASPIINALDKMPDIVADNVEKSVFRAWREYAMLVQDAGIDVSEAQKIPPKRPAKILREKAFEASRQTMQRLKGDVMETLAQAVTSGLGERDAAKMIADNFVSMRDFELRRVARTEIHSAQAEVASQSMQRLGVRYHQWIAANDERTRQTHSNNNGLIAVIGATFPNGQTFAGDRNADISEWINCRCRMVPYIPPRGKNPPIGRDVFRESEVA
jgi:SPP1 gp7 family putative phage head morphogenesis protein